MSSSTCDSASMRWASLADVTGRPKHLWSIYEKMVVRGKEFDDINDLVAIRVVVESEKDCWAALGAIHAIWAPVHGRFKDYINTPKFNMYQSLHTTVIGLDGKPVEVQIRTSEMHHRAEYGIAAHWGYKSKEDHSSEMAWLQRIADVDRQTDDPIEFLEALKLDLEQDEVYVFTPKGKVIALPARSTPVDFAYAIHTEVGHRCIGAQGQRPARPARDPAQQRRHRRDLHVEVADRRAVAGLAPDRRLDPRPQQDPAVVLPGTAGGRHRERPRGAVAGPAAGGTAAAQAARLVCAGAGRRVDEPGRPRCPLRLHRRVTGLGPVDRPAPDQGAARGGAADEQLPTIAIPGPGRPRQSRRTGTGVYVEGLDDVMIHLARCCTPVPGDQIVGFVTQGRGVSVHRADCANATALADRSRERLIEVEWDRGNDGVFVATIEVQAFDRSRLLADVSRVVSEHHLNIVAARTATTPDRVSRMAFDVELADPTHLHSLISALKHLDGVFDAYRQLPGKKA